MDRGRSSRALRALAGLCLALAACGGGAGEPARVAAGADGPPRRVLAANSSAFDVLIELVPRERLAAIPAPALLWSPLPGGRAAWAGLPVLERLEGELVLALRPDLVIASSWSDRAPLEVARRAGIRVLELPDARTWEDLVQAVRSVGAAVGEAARAEQVIAGLEARRAALAARAGPKLRILPYSNFGAGGTTSGTDTTIDLMIRLAGHVNAAAEAGLARHADIDLEQVLAIDPDAFLTASGKDDVRPGAEYLRGEQALAGLEAIREGRIVVLPAELFSTASHRVLDAAEFLERELR